MSAKRPPRPPSEPVSARTESAETSFSIPSELDRRPLDGAVRRLCNVSWSDARRWIETGKISIDGQIELDSRAFVNAGARLELRMHAPRPRVARRQEHGDLVVYIDPSVVVVRKPAGIATIPYGDQEPASDETTFDSIVRDVVAHRDSIRGRAPLGVVHRLDKQTSGVMVFARTFAAKKHLSAQFRRHSVHRLYLAIVQGDVGKKTFRSLLVPNRGDGLRGSRKGGLPAPQDQEAVTHVEPRERLRGATLVACRLETGRTHQIRIHLSEAGHPLVGEKVYTRGFAGALIPAPRLMLHAAELGFEHPVDGRFLSFEDPPPADFAGVLARLRRG